MAEILAQHISPDLYQEPDYQIPGVGYIAAQDSHRVRGLIETPGQNLSLNLVIIPPDEPGAQVPLRSALYAAEAFTLSSWLQDQGNTVSHIRVASPIYVAAAINHTDAAIQQQTGEETRNILSSFKKMYWPNLHHTPLVIDFGEPLDLSDSHLIAAAEQTAANLGENLTFFLQRAANHNGVGDPDELATALYIYAHGPIWRYTSDPRIARPENGQLAINLACQAEAPYFNALVKLGLLNSHGPITALTRATTYAPYYYFPQVAEPPLALENITPRKLQEARNQLKAGPLAGHTRAAELRQAYGILQTILQTRQKALR